MTKFFPLTTVTLIAFLASTTVKAECIPEKVMFEPGKGKYSIIGYTTIVPSAFSSYIFANSSETSGCGVNRTSQEAQLQFIAETKNELVIEMAQARGPRLAALSSLMGCTQEVQPLFQSTMQRLLVVEIDAGGQAPNDISPESFLAIIHSQTARVPVLVKSCRAA